ncbi:uncharacterized protein A4U43_C07F5720 [Asparagus officinalis]|uniref:Leucine-rich repeat-containing N-terminal plant-type domain-containing protein n=1 Tax=Asparagus officinalis TaxID=4686 RepID=A0A5P1EA21_ASPOF|nr:uncharacterized protein A4U43_C07F5720 [Asparagus officinalis]
MFTSVEGPLPNFKKNTAITLDLHSNLLKGPIPLPPTSIIIVDYSNNSFSSFIPPKLTSYLNFTIFFSLAHNNVTGETPPSICNAINLVVLDFSDNGLNGLCPPCLLESYNELRVLNLGGNQLRGTIPWNISEGCGLRTINFNDNHLEGNVPKLVTRCSELEVLDLGSNHISGLSPFGWGAFVLFEF